MKINILTLFPQHFDGWLNTGVIGKAVEKNLVEINLIDFREYTDNKHKKVDDYPYSGTDGMLLKVQPLDAAVIENNLQDTKIVFPAPHGRVFNQSIAQEYANIEEITFVAGRYEGIDQRFIDMHVDEMVSLGDFILTGGEVAIETILDATIRLIPGVLGNGNSSVNDSFSNGLLEHPQYTRPAEYKGLKVPEVLINGNHKLIEEFQTKESLKATYKNRPDLLEEVELTEIEKKYLKEIMEKNGN